VLTLRELEVSRADLVFEAAFPAPVFSLFRDPAGLLERLYARLASYGLGLNDLRVERGTGQALDLHILVYLFNYTTTLRVRVDRVEVVCSELPREDVERITAAIIDALSGVREYRSDLSFATFAVVVNLHGTTQGQAARDYLAQFVTRIPTDLGALLGTGVVFYFGPRENRLLVNVTVDRSAVITDGLFVRVHGVWDGRRIEATALPQTMEALVRESLAGIGLALPELSG